jgi:hypothetical protein
MDLLPSMFGAATLLFAEPEVAETGCVVAGAEALEAGCPPEAASGIEGCDVLQPVRAAKSNRTIA